MSCSHGYWLKSVRDSFTVTFCFLKLELLPFVDGWLQEFGYVHLSAGDLLRAERASGSPDGDLIEHHITAGSIVPVEITVRLLEKVSGRLRCNSTLCSGVIVATTCTLSVVQQVQTSCAHMANHGVANNYAWQLGKGLP